jgi:hypothetical protein
MYREWKKIRIPKKALHMNSEKPRLIGRPRNRWQDEMRLDGRLVGGKGWKEKGVYQRGMEETPGNGKKSSHSGHASGVNDIYLYVHTYISKLL